MATKPKRIRRGARLGKYRIERRLGEGGFATVYQAHDLVEGIKVALKVPHAELVDDDLLEDFRNEVRLTSRLDHPNILKIKNASTIGDQFVIAYPLGERTLADRLANRLAASTAHDYWLQMLEALAHAHRRRVIHCDVKPENLLLFPGNRLLLTDFGIAKVALHTVATASGTLGYMAPEQAMGRTSFRSDVFSAGLIAYRMHAGCLPEWPFDWPPPGIDRLRGKLTPSAVEILRQSLALDPNRRFESAGHVLTALKQLGTSSLKNGGEEAARRTGAGKPWREIRWQQFIAEHGGGLELTGKCRHCRGPVAQAMRHCPWCGDERRKVRANGETTRRCPRCSRGLKPDWRYCPWCYGGSVAKQSQQHYPNENYRARCSNRDCPRRELMPFMRYCPWCRRKVSRQWTLANTKEKCRSCRWGIASEYWDFCAWCGEHT